MIIENFEISEIFRKNFPNFSTNVAAFGRIVLQGGMIFWSFFCFKVYTTK